MKFKDIEFTDTMWKTSDGQYIKVHDLMTSHIINIMRCLNGQGKKKIPHKYAGLSRTNWLDIFTYILNYRSNGLTKELYPIY